jgi:type I restriction enzyme S subunit
MGNITDMIYGSSLTKAQCIPNGKYPVYGSNGIVGLYNDYLTEKHAIIVGRKGSSGALNISDKPSWTTDVAYYIEETNNIDFSFLFYLLKSQNLENLGKGIKPGLNRNEFYELVAALPPLAEQQAIVSKVRQLMAWCDELEKKIEKRDAYREKMMQAVVKQAFKTEKEKMG